MSVTIDSVTIGSVEDRRLVLSNAQAARVMSIGTNWNSLRISCRLAFSDAGGNIGGSPRFFLGVLASPSAGMANGPLTASTSHFVGCMTQAATWTRQTAPLRYQVVLQSSSVKKVGSTITTVAGPGTTGWFSADPAAVRTMFCVEIEKGSPNFKMTTYFLNDISFGDVALAVVPDLCGEIPGLASAGGSEVQSQISAYTAATDTYATHPITGLAVNEAVDGNLNAVCVAWDQSVATCHISDLKFSRIS